MQIMEEAYLEEEVLAAKQEWIWIRYCLWEQANHLIKIRLSSIQQKQKSNRCSNLQMQTQAYSHNLVQQTK